MKNAKFLKHLDGFTGDARLFELDPPLDGSTFVVVSATTVLGRPETYIFPADENGSVINWGEMEGSFQGGKDHTRALANAGYEVAS